MVPHPLLTTPAKNQLPDIRQLMIAPPSTKPPKGLLGAWLLASVAGAFEPKDRYGARGRTSELSSIESV
jgi:hypothetical protein